MTCTFIRKNISREQSIYCNSYDSVTEVNMLSRPIPVFTWNVCLINILSNQQFSCIIIFFFALQVIFHDYQIPIIRMTSI